MTHTTCPSCRLRFTPATAATLPRCPFCGSSLAVVAAEQSVGYELADLVVSLADLPEARAASMPLPVSARPPRV